ncbi:MAG TPA: hypothetical protein DCS75_01735 [Gemmatimonadetes bacterium]|nr:hypothetical protein [Gemmatimonadota bacterium]
MGLALGVTYSIGGFFIDLLTVELKLGTLTAFEALVGMPLISAILGFLLDVLEQRVCQNALAYQEGGILKPPQDGF